MLSLKGTSRSAPLRQGVCGGICQISWKKCEFTPGQTLSLSYKPMAHLPQVEPEKILFANGIQRCHNLPRTKLSA